MRISDWSSDVCSSDLSVVIGDRETDMQLAQNLGCRGLRLAPGHHDWAQIAHLLADAPRTAQVQRTTRETDIHEIGRASWRERVCKNVSISMVAGSFKTKTKLKIT